MLGFVSGAMSELRDRASPAVRAGSGALPGVLAEPRKQGCELGGRTVDLSQDVIEVTEVVALLGGVGIPVECLKDGLVFGQEVLDAVGVPVDRVGVVGEVLQRGLRQRPADA